MEAGPLLVIDGRTNLPALAMAVVLVFSTSACAGRRAGQSERAQQQIDANIRLRHHRAQARDDRRENAKRSQRRLEAMAGWLRTVAARRELEPLTPQEMRVARRACVSAADDFQTLGRVYGQMVADSSAASLQALMGPAADLHAKSAESIQGVLNHLDRGLDAGSAKSLNQEIVWHRAAAAKLGRGEHPDVIPGPYTAAAEPTVQTQPPPAVTARTAEVQPPAAVLSPQWPSGSRRLPEAKYRKRTKDLPATRIYKLVAKSVYWVAAGGEGSEGVSLGSAVAVSAHHLLTNCHVLQGHTTIIVGQKAEFGRVAILAADMSSDRCWLGSDLLSFKPVRGVRRFEDLQVGETVYSVGTPRRLESTLGPGLISGKRGDMMVQTNAPISPGSSGGGLFDSQGNLVGITMGFLKDAQSLNFCIAADAYWRMPALTRSTEDRIAPHRASKREAGPANAREATPDERTVAEERDWQGWQKFEEGRRAYDSGEYRDAWDYFRQAYVLSRRPRFLYHVGLCADRLGFSAEALKAFRMYLRDARKPSNRREVENRVRALEKRVQRDEDTLFQRVEP